MLARQGAVVERGDGGRTPSVQSVNLVTSQRSGPGGPAVTLA